VCTAAAFCAVHVESVYKISELPVAVMAAAAAAAVLAVVVAVAAAVAAVVVAATAGDEDATPV
jgi:hypothetical protein